MASLSAPITALRQRFSGRKRSGLAGELDPSDPQVQLQQLGDRLRERRESLDLTMRQLALDTRVSTPVIEALEKAWSCLLYTSPSPRDGLLSRMPSSA